MKYLIIIFILVNVFKPLFLTDEEGAQRILEKKGYTEITFNGYKWFACASADIFITEFKAKNFNGVSESGVVCSGFNK